MLVGLGVFHQDVKEDWPDLLMSSSHARSAKKPEWLAYPTYPAFDTYLGPFNDAEVKPDPAASDPNTWKRDSREWLQYQSYLTARDQLHNSTLSEAKTMIAAENYRDAVDVLRDGMVKFPTDHRFADQLEDTYLALGRFEDAYQLMIYRAKADKNLLGNVAFLDRLSAASGALGEVYPGQAAFLRGQVSTGPMGDSPKDVEFLGLLTSSLHTSGPDEAAFDHSLAERARKLEPNNPLAFYTSLKDGMSFYSPPTTTYAHTLERLTSPKTLQQIYVQSPDDNLKEFIATDVRAYINNAVNP